MDKINNTFGFAARGLPQVVQGFFRRWEMITFRKALEHRASEMPEKTFILFEDQSVTNREVDDFVNQIANGLIGLNVRKEKITLPFFCPTDRSSFMHIWPTQRLGRSM
jgi:non-ribosomal peptide synthetase component E (peptide arylation enzyme)